MAEATAVHEEEESNKTDDNNNEVKLIIYDFDQTISKLHLYRELHGGKLNALSKISDDKLISIFGGNERITILDKHFKFLTNKYIETAVISFGWTQVIKKSLTRLNLAIYFEKSVIIGRDSKEIIIVNKNKGKVVESLMEKRNLNYNEVLFVDDDLANIQPAAKICKTLHIETRDGMTSEHISMIEKQIYLYNEDEIECKINKNNENNEEKENKQRKKRSTSSLAKYKIKSVPKWFDDLNKIDDDTPVIEIKENNTSNHKQEVKISTKFTFENINDD
eukprot:316756_1